MGFAFIGRNVVQLGRNGTRFDYVRDGGQDNLFFNLRLAAEATLFEQHSVVFVYQPIDVRTNAIMRQASVFDNVPFASGMPVDIRYGFDFYRLSYLYDFFADRKIELSIGASLQIRNASLAFISSDGTRGTTSNDIGFVPTLKLRARYTLDNGVFFGLEADGCYVSGSFLPTGRNARDFEASIYDIALRAGARVTSFAEIYGSFRVLGGGARATEKNPRPGIDGFSENWLNTVVLSLGASVF